MTAKTQAKRIAAALEIDDLRLIASALTTERERLKKKTDGILYPYTNLIDQIDRLAGTIALAVQTAKTPS